jgi:hypothetical protein
MACSLFPLSVSFDLGETVDGEVPMSKLALPSPNFLIARFREETDDHFFVKVEQAVVNVVGRYARGEHDVCIAVVLIMGHLHRVFEQDGVPYGPCLEPGSEASKKAANKRKVDTGAGPTRKRVKVSSWKAMAPKARQAPRGSGTTLSKMALAKDAPAPHAKSVLKASGLPRASVPPKSSVSPKASAPPNVGAPMKAIVSKSMVAVATSKARVHRISTRTKGPSADSLPARKGKQVRVDVPPTLASAPTRKAMTQLQPLTESDDG